jgi:hypothetical protein
MAPADDFAESDPQPMPAEFQYLLIVAALFALLLLAGLPGEEPPTAGERGLDVPRREWATRWTEQSQGKAADQQGATEQAAPTPTDAQR